MSDQSPFAELEQFATRHDFAGLTIFNALASADVRRDGSPITRMALLLADPVADTWELEDVNRLRREVALKAAELDLPEVVLTLVPQAEKYLVDAFVR